MDGVRPERQVKKPDSSPCHWHRPEVTQAPHVCINRLALQPHLWRRDACAGREGKSIFHGTSCHKRETAETQPSERQSTLETLLLSKIIAEASLESHQWQWGRTDTHAHTRPTSATAVEFEEAPAPRPELSCAVSPPSCQGRGLAVLLAN